MSSQTTSKKSKKVSPPNAQNVVAPSPKAPLATVSLGAVMIANTKKPSRRKPKKIKEFHFRSWFIGQARRIYRRFPPFYIVRDKVKETYYITSKKGKPMKRVRFECELCHTKVNNGDIKVDHIDPILAIKGFPLNADGSDNWNEYLPRLFCDVSNLQAICTTCHDAKTLKEKQEKKLLTKIE